MKICISDYETYFGDDYTLSKQTTESYIRDPRFEAHGCAFKWVPDPAFWVPGPDLRDYFKSIDWSDVLQIHWHSHFDGLISSHHYGVKPKLHVCAMSMARARLPHSLSVSLEAVRAYMGMPAKTTPYNLFKNKRWHELDAHTQKQLGQGACDEVESIWALFKYFAKDFPADELELIDLTVRMFTDPALGADVDMLAAIWEREAQTKESRMKALNIDEKQLQSAEKFAELLRAEGVEPQKKNGKNGDIYAFAKTDEFMKELLEDECDRVRALAEARLGAKSTLLQTRAETLGWMASRGNMCVYLRYCGAHTTRWSGGDGCNWQNFRRDSRGTDISIRKSITAPLGYKVVAIDLSQIECIAENQLVLTRDRGLIPIQDIGVDDFVWDGIEWVSHQGIVCHGEREVITYQGLTATREHIVYTKDGSRLEFARAAEEGRNLRKTSAAVPLHKETLHRTVLQRLQDIWGARDRVPLRKRANDGGLRPRTSSTPNIQWSGNRPQKQRRSLRTWKSAAIHAATKCQQSLHYLLGTDRWRTPCYAGLQTSLSRMRLWSRPDKRVSATGVDRRRYYSALQTESMENSWEISQKETRPIQTAKVYDIINAGPRHRFTVSGVLVSNCRILNWCAGQTDIVDKFRNKEDPYIGIASKAYGFEVTKANEAERGTGKQLELSCGYGAGAATIQKTAAKGTYGPPVQIDLATATRWRDLYRNTHPAVVRYWDTAGHMLGHLAGGSTLDWGVVGIKDHKIWLPNGLYINYEGLEWFIDPESDDRYWRLRTRRGWSKIYGGKLVENVCQSLARVVIGQAMVRINRLGYRIVNQEHDAIWVLVPTNHAASPEGHIMCCVGEMTRQLPWAPDLPLDAEWK